MARRPSPGALLAAVAWALAGGCAHGPGAPPPVEPSVDGAKACAGINAMAALAGPPLLENALARVQALYCLELYAASLVVLSEEAVVKPVPDAIVDAVEERETPARLGDRAPALRWLVYIHRRFPGWERIVDMVGAVARTDLDRPDLADVRDDLHALAGRSEYQHGRFDEAVRLLRLIPASSPLHPQAVLLEGAAHVRAGNPVAALAAFEEARRVAPARSDPNHAGDLAVVSLARVYYAMAQFEAASRHYDLVPPSSPHWSAAALEGGWARYQIKDLPRALASVRALQARSSEVPVDIMAEAAMLDAAIAFQQLRPDDVPRILETFNAVFPDLFRQAKQLSGRDADALFDLAFSVRAGGALPPPLGAGPTRLLLADVPLVRRFDELDELARETARYDALDGAFRASPQGQKVSSDLVSRQRMAAREVGDLFRRRLERLADRLAQQIKQSIRIEWDAIPDGSLDHQ